MRVITRVGIAVIAAIAMLTVATSPAAANHNVAERVSVVPSGSSRFLAATDDGSHVFFSVTDPSCTQGEVYYERSGGVTSPVSVTSDDQLSCAVSFAGASVDGTHVFFASPFRLTPDDLDNGWDLYERFGGQTNLVTTGPGDPQTGIYPNAFRISDDGTVVTFATSEGLIPQDKDAHVDVYQRSNGTTTMLSFRSNGLNAPNDEYLLAASADGSRVIVQTTDQLNPDDTNEYADIYERLGGTITLLTNWAHGGGAGTFRAPSQNATRVIITTTFNLDPADTNTNKIDIYELHNGQHTLLSRGNAGGAGPGGVLYRAATPDALSVWFASVDQLTPDDTDATQDLYERSNGTTTLISTGPTAGAGVGVAPSFLAQSGNGATTYFRTNEALVPEDTDSDYDVYARSAGTTSFVTQGSGLIAVSDDGSRVFVGCEGGDNDGGNIDICEQYNGSTTLISSSPDPAAAPSFLGGISPDGLTVYFNTRDDNGEGNVEQDVYAARVAPPAPYARPKGATPFMVPLVPFLIECGGVNAPNTTHGAPLSFPSCAPPKTLHSQVTIGTPDFNGQPAKSVGSVRVSTKAGDPLTPENEADVRLQVQDTDIRKASDLSDYVGELEVALGVRQTDKDGTNTAGNGPASATSVDFPFHFGVGCTETADGTVGSTCDVDTSANALVPGSVVELRRNIWELQEVQVLDGGLDGVAATENDNLLFQVQGIFIP